MRLEMLALNELIADVRHNKCRGALLLFGVFGILAPSLTGQSSQQSQKASTKPKQSSAVTNQSRSSVVSGASHYLRVTINPSTANIIEGAVYGLDAELENISTVPVTVDFSRIELTVQPELAPPQVSCTWYYPAYYNDRVPSPMVMQPGDRFTVFFDTGSAATEAELKDIPNCRADHWARLRRRLDFVPGNFAFVLTGTFTTPAALLTSAQPVLAGTSPAGSVAPSPTGSAATSPTGATATSPSASAAPGAQDQHYFTETASLPVTIDQSQIILYAGIGGLLAFLVMSFRNASTLYEYAGKVQAASAKPQPKLLIILRGATAAIILSATVTVIASRLSTTAFPVKVSVEDFWGALTVGFVSYFIGGKFIDKLSETLTPGSQPSPAGPGPAPNAPAPAPPITVAPAPTPAAPGTVAAVPDRTAAALVGPMTAAGAANAVHHGDELAGKSSAAKLWNRLWNRLKPR